MSETQRIADVRVMGAPRARRRRVEPEIGAPANAPHPPRGHGAASSPQVVFAEIKPRLTQADLLARHRKGPAGPRPIEASLRVVEPPAAARARGAAAPLAWFSQGLGLAAALLALGVGTPAF